MGSVSFKSDVIRVKYIITLKHSDKQIFYTRFSYKCETKKDCFLCSLDKGVFWICVDNL